jgi:hypothetical protein
LNRSLPAQWDEEAILARADHLSEVFSRRWQRPEGGAPASSVAALQAARETTPVGRPATVKVPQARRDVARHMREAFAGLPVRSTLTVSQIVAVRTSQYEAGEISAGAVAARLRADNVPGIRPCPAPARCPHARSAEPSRIRTGVHFLPVDCLVAIPAAQQTYLTA